MNEKITVYVSGNPDGYPLEYYDKEKDSFQGVIPELFEEFSKESKYNVVYYKADGRDHREAAAKNHQTDIVSGYGSGDEVPKTVGKSLVFSTYEDGKKSDYYIYYTKSATKGLEKSLEKYFDSVSQEEVSGMILATEKLPAEIEKPISFGGVLTGAIIFCLVVFAVGKIFVGRRRKSLEEFGNSLEAREARRIENLQNLYQFFDEKINDKTRILYQIIYVNINTASLSRMVGREGNEAFVEFCADVLRNHKEPKDALARIGMGGFVLIGFGSDVEKTKRWLDGFFDEVKGYGAVHGKVFELACRAGVYNLDEGDDDLDKLIFYTFQGACQAGRENKNYILCNRDFVEKLKEELQLMEDFEEAIENDQFLLYLQFYVEAHGGGIVGAEALSRWKHPRRGILTPGHYIPLAERKKLITKLDYHVLRKVCEFLDQLKKKGEEYFFISCNFSRDSFSSVDFVKNCCEIIDEYDFPRELLIFEMTDGVSSENPYQINENILQLKEYGVRIALDDFGEGFTSFYDLARYHIDGLKLDKGLIDSLDSQRGRKIVESMIQVGHELGMTVLAEGVEREEDAEILRSMSCDVIQGYLYWHPIPSWEVEKILFTHLERRRSHG